MVDREAIGRIQELAKFAAPQVTIIDNTAAHLEVDADMRPMSPSERLDQVQELVEYCNGLAELGNELALQAGQLLDAAIGDWALTAPIEEIRASLRRHGGDPDGIAARGEELVRKLTAERRTGGE